MKIEDTPRNSTPMILRRTSSRVSILALTILLSELSVGDAIAQEGEDVFELSPFLVEGSSDAGYAATQTLSGTRLRSTLGDIAAPIDVLTSEFLEDIGATNLDDALSYGVNSAEWSGNLLTEDNGQPLTGFASNIQMEIRGFPSQSISRDFFSSIYKPDNYNSSRLTMSRGPNAILYGIGSPAGVVDSSSSQALLGVEEGRITLKTDSEGSFRSTVDYNKPLIGERLSVRVSAMTEEREGWRDNDTREDERFSVAFNAQVSEKTALRANYEKGSANSFYSPPWPVYDGFSVWEETGSQLESSVGKINSGSGIPAKGIARLTNTPYLVDGSLSPAGTSIPALSWRRMGTSGFPTAGVLLNRPMSLVDESLISYDQNLMGGAKRLFEDFEGMSFFANQKVTEDFHLEFAVNRQETSKDAWSGLAGGQQPLLRTDVNENLPNGDVNPNAGMYYIESSNIAIFSKDITQQQDSMRLTASYDLDLRERSKLLGRHEFAVLAQSVELESVTPSLDLFNTTPAAFNAANGLKGATAFPSDVINPRNKVKLRYYLDPVAGDVTLPMPDLSQYSMVYSGDAMPTADASGYTPALIAARPQSNVFSRVDSLMGVVMSRFWDDRIITTLGVREDTQEVWVASRELGSDGLYLNPHSVDARVDTDLKTRSSGQTSTKGIVFKATDTLSFTYGVSDTFSPNGDLRDALGRLIPATTAEGVDFGARLRLWEGKVDLGLNFYETDAIGSPSAYVRTVGGNVKGNIGRIWGAIEEFTGESKYGTAPYSEISAWSGVMDQRSEGMEFVMIANPNPNWRTKLSITQQDALLTNVAANIVEYVDFIDPILMDPANAAWLDLASSSKSTVAQDYADLQRIVARKKSLDGVKNTTQAEWAVNLVNNYTFSDDSLLKGFGFGQSLRYRSASGIGYGDDAATGGFDADNVFEGDDSLITGAWLSYKKKRGNGNAIKFQLNVDNLFGEGLLQPHEAQDDGSGNPIISRYRFITPRRGSFTVTFDF